MSQEGTGYEVRQARPSDAAAIARIHAESFASTYVNYPKTLNAALSGRSWEPFWTKRLGESSGRTLVATAGAELVGFIDISASSDHDGRSDGLGHIRSIHVAPSRAGSGIGNLLMEAGDDLMKELGFGEATLWVVSDNRRAQTFYERLGWLRDDGRRLEKLAVGEEDGDRVEVVRYRKILAPRRDPS